MVSPVGVEGFEHGGQPQRLGVLRKPTKRIEFTPVRRCLFRPRHRQCSAQLIELRGQPNRLPSGRLGLLQRRGDCTSGLGFDGVAAVRRPVRDDMQDRSSALAR